MTELERLLAADLHAAADPLQTAVDVDRLAAIRQARLWRRRLLTLAVAVVALALVAVGWRVLQDRPRFDAIPLPHQTPTEPAPSPATPTASVTPDAPGTARLTLPVPGGRSVIAAELLPATHQVRFTVVSGPLGKPGQTVDLQLGSEPSLGPDFPAAGYTLLTLPGRATWLAAPAASGTGAAPSVTAVLAGTTTSVSLVGRGLAADGTLGPFVWGAPGGVARTEALDPVPVASFAAVAGEHRFFVRSDARIAGWASAEGVAGLTTYSGAGPVLVDTTTLDAATATRVLGGVLPDGTPAQALILTAPGVTAVVPPGAATASGRTLFFAVLSGPESALRGARLTYTDAAGAPHALVG